MITSECIELLSTALVFMNCDKYPNTLCNCLDCIAKDIPGPCTLSMVMEDYPELAEVVMDILDKEDVPYQYEEAMDDIEMRKNMNNAAKKKSKSEDAIENLLGTQTLGLYLGNLLESYCRFKNDHSQYELEKCHYWFNKVYSLCYRVREV